MPVSAAQKQPKKKEKKPFHIKRADLHLEEYVEEQNSKDPRLLVKRAFEHLKHSLQFKLFILLQVIAIWFGHGLLMLIIGLIWAMLANTGKRKEGEKSAYSLFNEGVEA